MTCTLDPEVAAQINATDYGDDGLTVPHRIAGRLNHRPHCRGERLVFLVRPRDNAPVLRCTGCTQYMRLTGGWLREVLALVGIETAPLPGRDESPAEDEPPAEDPPTVAPTLDDRVTVRARWFCREHERPVNWRGHGCAQCTADRDRRYAALAERRAARADALRERAYRHPAKGAR